MRLVCVMWPHKHGTFIRLWVVHFMGMSLGNTFSRTYIDYKNYDKFAYARAYICMPTLKKCKWNFNGLLQNSTFDFDFNANLILELFI